MIQDIYPHRLNNKYKNKTIREDSYVFIGKEGRFLCGCDKDQIYIPKVEDVLRSLKTEKFTYAFSLDDRDFFFYNGTDYVSENYEFLSVREIRERGLGPKHCVFALLTAKHISDWYSDNKYCGRCSLEMKHSLTERAMVCSCGYTCYPRIMPAVIVAVIKGDSLLLTKYKTGYKNYALVAGFTEIGETLEQTVEREVMEETGIKVKDIKYYKSQPWGVANDILVGFFCYADGDDKIVADKSELGFAGWIKREDIKLQPDDYSLTNEMMMKFKTGEVI